MKNKSLRELRLQKWNRQLNETEKEINKQMRKANNSLKDLSGFKGYKKKPKNFAKIQRKAMNKVHFLMEKESRLIEKICNIDLIK
jgi:hypothetical protein